ncbi:MAG: hypothetical protein MPW17_22365 (plasmid) [Candidatus Manganitrophus sp.]|nr:MAG: hypothetical protein MPW17_22365 [Candidatus Manganitrophus sp.]
MSGIYRPGEVAQEIHRVEGHQWMSAGRSAFERPRRESAHPAASGHDRFRSWTGPESLLDQN